MYVEPEEPWGPIVRSDGMQPGCDQGIAGITHYPGWIVVVQGLITTVQQNRMSPRISRL